MLKVKDLKNLYHDYTHNDLYFLKEKQNIHIGLDGHEPVFKTIPLTEAVEKYGNRVIEEFGFYNRDDCTLFVHLKKENHVSKNN